MKFGVCDGCGKTGLVGLVACAEVHLCADCAARRFDADREKVLAEFRARLITKYLAEIRERWWTRGGPTRILLNADGEAKPPNLAGGVSSDVIFVREDGWSIGAPQALELAAYRLWPEDWLGVITLHFRPDGTFETTTELISDWRERKGIER